jgi:hypothetical protein
MGEVQVQYLARENKWEKKRRGIIQRKRGAETVGGQRH